MDGRQSYATITASRLFGNFGWYIPHVSGRLFSARFARKIKEAYFAFEALTEHPYGFWSFLHGYYPDLLTADGCTKVATENVSFHQFRRANETGTLDIDHHHQLLKLTMMSPMVFHCHLRFVDEAAPTFSPFNRVSNRFLQTQTRQIPSTSSGKNKDGARLAELLGDNGIKALGRMKKAKQGEVYGKCVGRGVNR